MIYTCEECGGEFESEWSIADAEDEVRRTFGAVPAPEDRAVVCEDCYERLKAWAIQEGKWPH